MLHIASILRHLLETMTIEEVAKEIGISVAQVIYLRDGGELDDITRKRLELYIAKKNK